MHFMNKETDIKGVQKELSPRPQEEVDAGLQKRSACLRQSLPLCPTFLPGVGEDGS